MTSILLLVEILICAEKSEALGGSQGMGDLWNINVEGLNLDHGQSHYDYN